MPHIITISNTNLSRQALAQKADKKQLKRLFRGAYMDVEKYEALDVSGRYRAHAKAFLATHPKLRAWGITAAALEGAPVLLGAALHFAGKRSNAKSKQRGCMFHGELPLAPLLNNYTARILFECALTSPLSDALIAANYLLHRLSQEAAGGLSASREINRTTTETLLWYPLETGNSRIRMQDVFDKNELKARTSVFLKNYSAARRNKFASPEAELAWLDFAQLCMVHREKRAIGKALYAGLHFSDQAESPAESLLLARTRELGFITPYLQVNIIDPGEERHLGRVDGMWPSAAVSKGLYQEDTKFGRFLFCKQAGDSDSIVVEFDGQLKYQQNYADVLEKERQRQNAINNLGFRFVRIGWDDLMQPKRLRSILVAAKVPKLQR